ncbi:23S rRNA (uracil(747)-C(5))-methyltransferase RlmC [Ursidibacter sp. B-7004-1]
MANLLNCQHFSQRACTSCQWLDKAYPQQLAEKTTELKRLLSPFILQQTEWLPEVQSSLSAFRNKAKMVVSGSVERPILGILNDEQGVDLTDCSLYPTRFHSLFPILKQFIGRAGLVPYNVAKKKGELKYILLTESQYNHAIMVRFVLRSETKLALIQREFPAFLAQLPPESVVTLNIQPQHSAVLEGEKEIFLTEQQVLTEYFNGVPLFIRPQGFFQTNPSVASQLYATAQRWSEELPIQHLWDLFCGVGGFGLHCASALQTKNAKVSLTGIEISPSAIASATKSAHQLGLDNVKFASLDSAHFALNEQGSVPDLVIVNPPRRGIGNALAEFLNKLGSPYLIYSSCNAHSMAKDFGSLSNYTLEKVQLFDMFPHTSHYEVLTFLKRIA